MLGFTSSFLPPPGSCGEAVSLTGQCLHPHPSWNPWVHCNGQLLKSVLKPSLCSSRPASPWKFCLQLAKEHFYCRNDKMSSHISRGISVRMIVRAITKSIRAQRQVPATSYRGTALALACRDTRSWEWEALAISGIFEPPDPSVLAESIAIK